MRRPGRPRVLVLAPDALFRSFFDGAAAAAALARRSAGRGPARARSTACPPRRWPTPTRWSRRGTARASPRSSLRRAPRLRIVAHCGGEVKGRFARPLFERLTITNAPGPMAAVRGRAGRGLPAVRRAQRGRASRGPAPPVQRRLRAHPPRRRGRRDAARPHGRAPRASAASAARLAALLRPLRGAPARPRSLRRRGRDPARGRRARRRWTRLLDGSRHLVLAAALTERRAGILDRRALAAPPRRGHRGQRGPRRRSSTSTRSPPRCAAAGCAAPSTSPIPRSRCPCAIRCGGCAAPILTPHVGAAQREVRAAMADIVLDDLERFFAGRRPRNRVTRGDAASG